MYDYALLNCHLPSPEGIGTLSEIVQNEIDEEKKFLLEQKQTEAQYCFDFYTRC